MAAGPSARDGTVYGHYSLTFANVCDAADGCGIYFAKTPNTCRLFRVGFVLLIVFVLVFVLNQGHDWTHAAPPFTGLLNRRHDHVVELAPAKVVLRHIRAQVTAEAVASLSIAEDKVGC